MENQDKKKNVLVIGDWIIDEHWITSIHRSSLANRTGGNHFRVLHEQESSVLSMSAAAKVAELLNKCRINAKDETLFDIYGLGLWHENDTEIFNQMVFNNDFDKKNHFSIIWDESKDKTGSRLYNLGERYFEKGDNKRIYPNPITTRIIRLYRSTGLKVELFQRIDWELPVCENDAEKETEFNKKLREELKNIDTIVIKDLGRGVITKKIIKLLVKECKNKEWYISSNQASTVWMEE